MLTKEKLHKLTLAGLLLAALIVCSQITIPLPIVPLTLQTFAVGLIASLLPTLYAFEVVVAYLLLGAVGLPVFAGFSGGAAVLISPTAGYLYSFVIYAIVTSLYLKFRGRKTVDLFVANVLGAALNLIIGSLWMVPVLGMSVKTAFMTGLVPFVIPALVKIILVVLIAGRLQKIKRFDIAA
ncbi:substrate-specific component [Liquorilactobacillus sucicola DSM 21376 = JCM 15457]|uniref:Biotin transporter n=1 Tax=Liquorilactobacillus sucicola DSM 21376 = JCM 15457 TaxID=1423806 RepID=A0A023CWJ8_9LACO|nr:biotin transporter BioY [Liquorilactobacillus sucicola]KRN06235.1 BioY protein [Liquorilactobacillus sucicola DSM 21376 = JCM 15457]GAJ26169.1 substrate-specific component [Liquorilactobacillus sucicola DSM 21376 = JCM 15457]